MRKYRQLTQEQRYQMHALLTTQTDITQKEIAQKIGVSPSTVSRELRRNLQSERNEYQAGIAHQLCDQRRRKASKFTKRSERLLRFLIKRMSSGWSPEQVANYLSRRTSGRISISHEFIYQWIIDDQATGGAFYTYLRREKKVRQKRHGSYSKRGILKNRISIHDRPAQIELREEVGHWEGDTVVGKGKQNALVTLVERATGFTRIRYVEDCGSAAVNREMMAVANEDCMESVTLDNGKEFAKHDTFTKETGIPVYFADPYSSWQRGTNENTNGLIRQYFPKGTDFSTVTAQRIQEVENMLNNRPRKRLGYRTPNQVWREAMNSDNYRVALNA